jgi:hypothetical protein
MSELSNKFGIDSFYRSAVQQGFARDINFRVLRLGDWVANQSDLLYISAATMPGRTVNSVAVPYMGLNFQVPGTANYNANTGWSVTFRCDEGLNVRNILENWSYGVFNDITSKGANIPSSESRHNVDLVSIDSLGNPRKAITLVGAWCTTVGDLTYNLAGNGQIITVAATIAYQYWRTAGTAVAAPAQPGDAEIGAL